MAHLVRQDLAAKTDDELADWMAGTGPGSDDEMAAQAEFLSRQLGLRRDSTTAIAKAAQAARETADYAQRLARYLQWSILAILFAAAVTIGATLLRHPAIMHH